MLYLKLLGGATVEDAYGRASSSAAHRHSMALLALLACAPSGTLSRGKLVGLLWPEVPERTARNRLNTYVHRLRSEFGKDVLESKGTSLRLARERVECDVHIFEKALDEGRPEAAVHAFRGPFMDGVWIPDSPEFDQWVDRERDRLRRRYREGVEALAVIASEEGAPATAARWWREIAREDRFDSNVTLRLMEALAAAGNRASALHVADEHVALLEKEFGARTGQEVRETARRMREAWSGETEVPVEPIPSAELDPRAVAVLPFEDLGGGEEGEVLAAGLHHDLLTQLSRSGDLKVISRTSMLRYQDGATPIPEIARALGAGTIVEGGLQQAGGRIRLNIQLIDGRSDEHRWAETYDRDLTVENLFEIRSELAARIAESLQAQLVPEGSATGEGGSPTESLEAYRLQVQGRARLDERTEGGMRKAVELFRQALQEDARYPLAWIGLADGLTLLFEYGYESAERTFGEAEVAARRAAELSPDLGEAHASLGLLHEAQHRGPDSIREHSRAVALQPSYADAHNWLSWTYQLLGRGKEALACSRRAVRLNPLSPEVVGNLATASLITGDPVTALREARRATALQPDESSATFYTALALHRLGRLHEARELLRDLPVPWAGSGARSTLAVLQARDGEAAAARETLTEFEAENDLFAAGVIRAALGERDEALETLAQVERWDWWPALAVHHHFPDVLGPLRADPRFGPILAAARAFWGLEADGSFPATPGSRGG